MKFKVKKEKFNDAMANVSRAISKKSTIPALEGVLINANKEEGSLRLTGYNLEIGIVQTIDAEVKEEGAIVLSAPLLMKIARKEPTEDIEFNVGKKTTKIKSGKADYEIVGMKADDYPDLPELLDTKSITLDAEEFADAVSTTAYCISDNNAKPVYTGALCEFAEKHLTIVAIDGVRMAVRRLSLDEGAITDAVVIPKNTLLELVKAQRAYKDEENMELILSKRHCSFKIGDIFIISRILEGDFLNYKTIIPKDFKTTVTIRKDTIADCVDRLGIVCNETAKIPTPIRVNIDYGINMTAQSSTGKGGETITPLECVIDGEPVEIGFNQRYLADAFSNISADNIKLSLTGPLTPMIITANEENNNEIHLVVPMRLLTK